MDSILHFYFKRDHEKFNAAKQVAGRNDLRMCPEWGVPHKYGTPPMCRIWSETAFCKLPYWPKDDGWLDAVKEALEVIAKCEPNTGENSCKQLLFARRQARWIKRID